MKLETTGKKIAWSTVVQYAGKIIQLAFAVFITKLLTNFFPNTIYGKYAWIIEYCLFFSVAANLGIFANSIRMISDSPDDGKLFFNALIIRILTAAVFFILAVIISVFISDTKLFVFSCAIFVVSLLLDFMTMIFNAYLQANYMMGRATFAAIIGKIIQFSLIYIIIKNLSVQPDYSAIPVVMLLTMFGSLITAVVCFFFVSLKLKLVFKLDINLSMKILKTGLPFGIINILNYLYFRFIPIALAQKHLDDAQFSSFDISFRIAFVLSLFSTFLMFSLMPAFKRSLSAKNWRFSYSLFKKTAFVLIAASIILVGLGTWAGPFIITLLTHKSFIMPQFWFIFPMFLILAAVSYFYDLILISLFSTEHDLWLLKCETAAFISACLIFCITYFIEDLQLRIFTVIMGAIAGEIIIVTLGMIKITGFLKAKVRSIA
ncbi:MAG: oligosaccharide flippase family protein [Spirochaetes bacterium]|nr:oligosaccharide flippase family protein [Spirochaetota bacterium]